MSKRRVKLSDGAVEWWRYGGQTARRTSDGVCWATTRKMLPSMFIGLPMEVPRSNSMRCPSRKQRTSLTVRLILPSRMPTPCARSSAASSSRTVRCTRWVSGQRSSNVFQSPSMYRIHLVDIKFTAGDAGSSTTLNLSSYDDAFAATQFADFNENDSTALFGRSSITVTAVPEPSGLVGLVCLAMLILLIRRDGAKSPRGRPIAFRGPATNAA